MVIPERNKNVVSRSRALSTVTLAHYWNPGSDSGHRVQEVIKKFPFGVIERFPGQCRMGVGIFLVEMSAD